MNHMMINSVTFCGVSSCDGTVRRASSYSYSAPRSALARSEGPRTRPAAQYTPGRQGRQAAQRLPPHSARQDAHFVHFGSDHHTHSLWTLEIEVHEVHGHGGGSWGWGVAHICTSCTSCVCVCMAVVWCTYMHARPLELRASCRPPSPPAPRPRPLTTASRQKPIDKRPQASCCTTARAMHAAIIAPSLASTGCNTSTHRASNFIIPCASPHAPFALARATAPAAAAAIATTAKALLTDAKTTFELPLQALALGVATAPPLAESLSSFLAAAAPRISAAAALRLAFAFPGRRDT